MTDIRQKTIVEQLMNEIRKMIADGTYKQSEKIPTEQELAERFSVSRTSVREAVKTLTYLGVLESRTSQGTRITKRNRIAEEATAWSTILGYEKMYEVFVLGTAIDTQVVIILQNSFRDNKSLKKDSTLFQDMNANIMNMLVAAKENDLEKYIKEFSQYFRLLYNEVGNNVFISLNDCIEGLIVEKVCTAYYMTSNLFSATNYLSEIWDCISNGYLVELINTIQDYGIFAYNCFSICYEKKERDH